ncbi:hypothetical protein KC19_VG098700 [Ceratodon purpureus]|uniref:Uncharacterized protein n=1 Tax=Ceratodon purpureus TaxID=3225 RepID=A0A8T0HNW4_CERPU|nr:hypothetical protein KC19_VG098700 [Ceratodon purpureus]
MAHLGTLSGSFDSSALYTTSIDSESGNDISDSNTLSLKSVHYTIMLPPRKTDFIAMACYFSNNASFFPARALHEGDLGLGISISIASSSQLSSSRMPNLCCIMILVEF